MVEGGGGVGWGWAWRMGWAGRERAWDGMGSCVGGMGLDGPVSGRCQVGSRQRTQAHATHLYRQTSLKYIIIVSSCSNGHACGLRLISRKLHPPTTVGSSISWIPKTPFRRSSAATESCTTRVQRTYWSAVSRAGHCQSAASPRRGLEWDCSGSLRARNVQRSM